METRICCLFGRTGCACTHQAYRRNVVLAPGIVVTADLFPHFIVSARLFY